MPDLAEQLRATEHPKATAAVIQAAIDAAAERGGGRVTVPPGTWTVTTIELRSGISLHLERGCVLAAHTDLTDYEPWIREFKGSRQAYHLLRADGCEGVTLEGDGAIDGRGESFWEEPLRDLVARGMDVTEDLARMPPHWPSEGPFWRAWKPRITPLVELRRCRNLAVRDITIRNSPGWTVHPFCCDDVRIEGITIDNHIYGPNTDGLDINGCRDVYVSGCRIVGCDDNIILKATPDARRCERVVVTNCNLKTNCAALGLGAETSRGICDVSFTNCVVEQALRMIQLEMWSEGVIENVVISNLSGNTLTPADVPCEKVVYCDIQRHRRGKGCELGRMRNVVISGITARTRGRCLLTACDGARIEDLTLRDIHIDYPEIEDAASLMPACRCGQNSNDNPESRGANAVLVADNVDRLRVENLRARLPAAGGDVPAFRGIFARNASGLLDCPHLASNAPDLPTLEQRGGELDVRALG